MGGPQDSRFGISHLGATKREGGQVIRPNPQRGREDSVIRPNPHPRERALCLVTHSKPRGKTILFHCPWTKVQGSEAAWSTLSWLRGQARFDFCEELLGFIYLDTINLYQLILMLLSHSQPCELE